MEKAIGDIRFRNMVNLGIIDLYFFFLDIENVRYNIRYNIV